MSAVRVLRKIQRESDWKSFDNLLKEHPELLSSKNTEELILLSICFILKGEPQKAEKFLSLIKEEDIKTTDAISDYGLLLFLTGKLDEAEKWLKEAEKRSDADEAVFSRLGTIKLVRGKLDEAEKYYEESLMRNPNKAEVISNLAGIKLRKGQLEEALSLYERALSIKPDLQKAEEQRVKILFQLNRAEELVEEAYEKLRREESPEAYIRLSQILLILGREDEAEAKLLSAMEKFPQDEKLKLAFIKVLFEKREYYKAGTLLKKWVEDENLDDQTKKTFRIMLNEARIECDFLEKAEEDINKMDPELPEVKLLKARLLIEKMKGQEAVSLLTDLIEKYPGLISAYNLMIQALTAVGRLDEAKKYAEKLSQLSPTAIVQKVEANDYKAEEIEIEIMKALFKNPVLSKEARASIGFTLHRVLDRIGEYKEAFSVLKEANELVKSTINYNWKIHRRLVQDTIRVFTDEIVKSLYGLGHPSKRPIFVLGMPRSGTTLVEQILSSHSKVFGAGELSYIQKIIRLIPKALGVKIEYPEALEIMNAQDLKNAGAYYLKKIENHNRDKPYVVDKLPHNFDYIGFILLIFPNAKIIHLNRDPMDVALSNYQQYFAAAHGLMGFAFDLEWIGHMLNDHKRIMEHWRSLFGERIYELEYEKLVSDPENTIKDLLSFLELEWEEGVMKYMENPKMVRTASVRQVRKGIYKSSVKKWKRYEEELLPVKRLLEEGFSYIETVEDAVEPAGIRGITR